MTVKCIRKSEIGTEENQITVGMTYLVLELIIPEKQQLKCSYRILNNKGIPCIYPSALFEIVSNRLDFMVITGTPNAIIITHKLIANASFKNTNFWGYVFETEDEKAVSIVKKAVTELNEIEDISLPNICFS